MKQLFVLLALTCLMPTTLHAGQSIITESEGFACMGEGSLPNDTEVAALTDAKSKAVKAVVSYIQSGLGLKNTMLVGDLLTAYNNAQVKVLQELMDEWYKGQGSSNCYRVKLKVEVVPDEKVIVRKNLNRDLLENDPSCPLAIKIWMNKNVYIQGDRMRIFIKANKPFYANVVYKQADSSLLQLLPNSVREESFFKGGVVYEIPSRDDRYNLEVSTPFGFENVTVYASTSPLGSLDIKPAGDFFSIASDRSDISHATRCVPFVKKEPGKMVAEFAEASVSTITRALANR